MRFLRSITICAVLVLAQLAAFGGEVAVLRNGFSIRFEHKEQNGNITRLYTSSGYMDIASNQIASFETEEAPVIPQPQPVASQPQPAASVPAVQTSAAAQAVAVQNPAPVATALAPAPVSATSQTIPAKLTSVDIDAVVREASSKNRLDPDFVNSVIKAESDFKVHAVSKKGAQGLMQLMPGTAAKLGVADSFDPKANVEAGTAYLSTLLDLYHDDPIKALAAYNAGAYRVKQYNGVPPYRETRAYIAKIVRDYNAKKRAQMKAAVATATAKAGKTAAAPAKTVTSKPLKKTKPQQAEVSKPANPA
ncbi:MAG TPA: lytic transglycosylase domain-containing protein [Candidatus Angelobacter sp.]|nr:lytic transglycosylase domain-containing protein [Candidatus Angelobacter sp.]